MWIGGNWRNLFLATESFTIYAIIRYFVIKAIVFCSCRPRRRLRCLSSLLSNKKRHNIIIVHTFILKKHQLEAIIWLINTIQSARNKLTSLKWRCLTPKYRQHRFSCCNQWQINSTFQSVRHLHKILCFCSEIVVNFIHEKGTLQTQISNPKCARKGVWDGFFRNDRKERLGHF